MIVAGVGSRETPRDILEFMDHIGDQLMRGGHILRSGGAPGADQAFEFGAAGAPGKMKDLQNRIEIYLPWAKFEEDNRSWVKPKLTEPADWAYKIAAEYHPRWPYLKQGAKKLHARNVHQVLGPFEGAPKSDAVVCWTKGAKGGGGTGQAIRIGRAFDVEIIDLADPNRLYEMEIAYRR